MGFWGLRVLVVLDGGEFGSSVMIAIDARNWKSLCLNVRFLRKLRNWRFVSDVWAL